MGCEFTLWLTGASRRPIADTAAEAFELVDRLEAQISHYRAQSELSNINASAATRPIRVEPRLFRILQQCVEFSRLTGGAFDITAFPLVRLWGFHDVAGPPPDQTAVSETLRAIGHRHLILDPSARTIAFDHPGVNISLAAIGKGLAVRRITEFLRERGGNRALISAGGSSVTAMAPPPDLFAWPVGIQHPLMTDTPALTLNLSETSLSTSGAGEQTIGSGAEARSHLIDPRTGFPAHGALSVSVVTPDPVEAEILSTALFVMSPSERLSFLRDRPELSVTVIEPSGDDIAIVRFPQDL